MTSNLNRGLSGDVTLREGMRIQPRYQAFLDAGGGSSIEYISWVTKRWADYRKAIGRQPGETWPTMHDDFTDWLTDTVAVKGVT